MDFKFYIEWLEDVKDKIGFMDVVVVVKGKVNCCFLVIVVMDFKFIGGFMGFVVGEKIVFVIDYCIEYCIFFLMIFKLGGVCMMELVFLLM